MLTYVLIACLLVYILRKTNLGCTAIILVIVIAIMSGCVDDNYNPVPGQGNTHTIQRTPDRNQSRLWHPNYNGPTVTPSKGIL